MRKQLFLPAMTVGWPNGSICYEFSRCFSKQFFVTNHETNLFSFLRHNYHICFFILVSLRTAVVPIHLSRAAGNKIIYKYILFYPTITIHHACILLEFFDNVRIFITSNVFLTVVAAVPTALVAWVDTSLKSLETRPYTSVD